MSFPLIEPYHVIIPLIPAIGYFLSKLNLNKRIITIIFIIYITLTFSTNIYQIYQKKITYPNVTTHFKYRRLPQRNDIAIKYISEYINTIEDELYIISVSAYTLKLEANKTINKYDLLNNGNLGKNGDKKIIKEIEENCNKNKCTFLVDVRELNGKSKTQYNKDIIKYIENNYLQTGSIGTSSIAIYKNY